MTEREISKITNRMRNSTAAFSGACVTSMGIGPGVGPWVGKRGPGGTAEGTTGLGCPITKQLVFFVWFGFLVKGLMGGGEQKKKEMTGLLPLA
jgi:hypothetical protein